MDYSKFKERLGSIKTATSIQGKTYDKIHISDDSIYYERESGSDESISIKELYYIYQNHNRCFQCLTLGLIPVYIIIKYIFED